MRTKPIRLLLVALVAFCLPVGLGAIASAQTTTQDTTSGYAQTTTTGDFAETNQEDPATTEDDEGEELPQEESGDDADDTGSAAAQSAPPAQTSTPSTLAFTGFEALLVGLVGVALMGAAFLLQRRRRA
jgi:hypothetical protein